MKLVRRMFPDLKTTRFRNSADFYSLFMIVWRSQPPFRAHTGETAELLMKHQWRDGFGINSGSKQPSAQRLYADTCSPFRRHG